MKTKEEAYAFALGQFDVTKPIKEKYKKWHYGKEDIKYLLDFIYKEKTTETIVS